jgi:hypothetical protein
MDSMDPVEEELEGPLLIRWKDVMKYVWNWDKIDYSCWYAVLDWAMNDRVAVFRLLKLPQEDRSMLKELHHVMCQAHQSTPISTNLPIKIRSDILWETQENLVTSNTSFRIETVMNVIQLLENLKEQCVDEKIRSGHREKDVGYLEMTTVVTHSSKASPSLIRLKDQSTCWNV